MEFPLGLKLVEAVQWLLPGFVAAWVFYGLTAHPRKDAFERAVQALVFTAFIQVAVMVVRESTFAIHRRYGWSIGTWSTEKELGLDLVLGLILGLLMSACAKHNWPHSRLTFFTNRTTSPSEWHRTFSNQERWSWLHLVDGRRLYGWVTEFPDSPEAGHFVIQFPAWILKSNKIVPLHQVHLLMIRTTEVLRVEFRKWPEEIALTDDELRANAQQIIELYDAAELAAEDGEPAKKMDVKADVEVVLRSETDQAKDSTYAERETATGSETLEDGSHHGREQGCTVPRFVQRPNTATTTTTASKQVRQNGDRKK